MTDEDSSDIPKLTGIQKVFNSYTIKGRMNTVIATYAGVALVFLYFKFRSPKEEPKK